MVEAVRPAVKTDPELRAYYDRLRHRKGPNPAKVATARRLLTIVHRVLKDLRHAIKTPEACQGSTSVGITVPASMAVSHA
jgi:hypothetical protein